MSTRARRARSWLRIDWSRPLTLASREQTPVPGHPSVNLLHRTWTW